MEVKTTPGAAVVAPAPAAAGATEKTSLLLPKADESEAGSTSGRWDQLLLLGAPTATKRVADLRMGARVWLWLRLVLLLLLCAVPFVAYRRNMHKLATAWYAPLMAVIASAVGSSGAPVAGGIIFYPFLTTAGGICPRDAIAFINVAQFLSCFIFTPLNWLVIDPTVFVLPVMRITLLPSVAGLVLAIFVLKLPSDIFLELMFAGFCLCIAAYVSAGLVGGKLNTKPQQPHAAAAAEARFKPLSWRDVAWYVSMTFVGGIIVGYISVGAGKVLFWLLTWRQKVQTGAASVTAITLMGLLSGVAAALHLLFPHHTEQAGSIPMAPLLMAAPGLLFGSMVGPLISATVGPRNVMIFFVLLLVYDAAKNVVNVLGESDVFPGLQQPCVEEPADVTQSFLPPNETETETAADAAAMLAQVASGVVVDGAAAGSARLAANASAAAHSLLSLRGMLSSTGSTSSMSV